MQHYDQIVVGSGISGMTLAALLAKLGKRVLLLEKGPRIGGSMLRFQRRGIPFDTGFHFTGGFADGGILRQMLTVLGIVDAIHPDPLRSPSDNCFRFEASGNVYALPTTYASLIPALKDYFPDDADGLDRFFQMIDRVCDGTVSMRLQTITQSAQWRPEDDISLASVLDDLIRHPELKTLLAAYSACYGVPASAISFANHARICHALYRSVARVQGGGEAFIDALQSLLTAPNVDIRCQTTIAECADIRDRHVNRFVLTSGESVSADDCIFTIHPQKILDLLPREQLHKAFVDRVKAFAPSLGFFCLYGRVRDDAAIPPFAPAIISLIPSPAIHRLLECDGNGNRVAVIMKHREQASGLSTNVLTAMEAAMPADTVAWESSVTGRRPPDYAIYKADRCQRLMERVLSAFPEFKGRLEVLETASMLTFRDYLHSPWGCAYGIRQTMGQVNLFGRLPLRNLHAAGQSAALPGLVGAMLTSFILVRGLIGRDAYGNFLANRLTNRCAAAGRDNR